MTTLATLVVVDHEKVEKHIEIVEGDLTKMGSGEDVDVLVISAFPNDYSPTTGSVIGALARAGVSVQQLARECEYDLRRDFSCWLSRRLENLGEGLRFARLLCYEREPSRPSASEGVANIFRALAPFLGLENPVHSVAMPLIACGDQEMPVEDLVEPLVRTAMQWMKMSQLQRVQIVELNPKRARQLRSEFTRIKSKIALEQKRPAKYEFFLSYSREDNAWADMIIHGLKELRSDVKVFYDVQSLEHGADYLIQIERSIRESKRFVALLSPAYAASNACKDEFSAAWSLREQDNAFIHTCLIREYQFEDPRMARLQWDDSLVKRKSVSEACKNMLKRLPNA